MEAMEVDDSGSVDELEELDIFWKAGFLLDRMLTLLQRTERRLSRDIDAVVSKML